MTWNPQGEQGNEASKVRWDLIPYAKGTLVDIGCGAYKVLPKAIGVDSGKQWGRATENVVVDTAEKLPIFGSQSVDCVFSSHLLEHIENWKAALREWWRLVKPGGYLCLYLPHKDYYPNCSKREEWKEFWEANKDRYKYGELAIEEFISKRDGPVGLRYAGTPYANQDHKHDFYPQDVINAMEEIGGFDLLENEEREGGEEYSFWQVYQKIQGKQVRHGWKEKPEKTAAVIRYGAIGDMIQASSVLPWLKENGYHVTVYCQPGAGYETIQHDPHVDRFVLQEKDVVPPVMLDQFWDHTRKKYTKWINLCESVEATLLASPGRANWEWPNEVRAKYLDRNYLEWTHELAGVPAPYRPKFYSTPEEKAWARKTKERMGKRVILWSLSGSSGHKTWPHIDAVIAGLMLEYPDVHVVTTGDDLCQILEAGWEDEPRVHKMSGKWTIRQSMAFAEVADLIIGTETGLLNAAGSMDAWKIVNLSHSSKEMLTKHWKNTIVLEQPQGVGCNKHPCRQLHGANGRDPWEDCPQEKETGTALCQFHIEPRMMWEAITSVLGKPIRIAA